MTSGFRPLLRSSEMADSMKEILQDLVNAYYTAEAPPEFEDAAAKAVERAEAIGITLSPVV